MGSRIESGRKYFSLRAKSGALSAVIPKGNPVSPDVINWTVADLNEYLRLDGYKIDIEERAFLEFRKAVRKNPSGFSEDYVLLNAISPVEPENATLEWLAVPGRPRDLVTRDIPFLRAKAPKPPIEGRDIYGRVLFPKNRGVPLRIHLQLDPEIVSADEETFIATQSGQVRIEGQKLRFSPTYQVTEIGVPELSRIEFPCSVHVKDDLAGARSWIVNGDLEVDGHWSSPDVTVHGNVKARSGIQTNMNGVIRIYGNAEVPFVQMSRLGITGNLLVESALLQSEIRVGGELRLRGSPGTIMGCSVDVFGNLICQKAGSDKGRRTSIRIHEDIEGGLSKVSRVAMLSLGTIMRVGGRSWTAKEDGFFSTED